MLLLRLLLMMKMTTTMMTLMLSIWRNCRRLRCRSCSMSRWVSCSEWWSTWSTHRCWSRRRHATILYSVLRWTLSAQYLTSVIFFIYLKYLFFIFYYLLYLLLAATVQSIRQFSLHWSFYEWMGHWWSYMQRIAALPREKLCIGPYRLICLICFGFWALSIQWKSPSE